MKLFCFYHILFLFLGKIHYKWVWNSKGKFLTMNRKITWLLQSRNTIAVYLWGYKSKGTLETCAYVSEASKFLPLCKFPVSSFWTLLTCLMYGYGRLLPQSNQSRMNREKSLLSAKAIYLCAYTFMLWQQSFFPNQKYRKHKCYYQKPIQWLFDGYMREKCSFFFYWIFIRRNENFIHSGDEINRSLKLIVLRMKKKSWYRTFIGGPNLALSWNAICIHFHFYFSFFKLYPWSHQVPMLDIPSIENQSF